MTSTATQLPPTADRSTTNAAESMAPVTAPATALAQTGSLYIGDLDPTITEAILFETFSVIGTVASVRVCRDTATRRSLGYAYVNYNNIADAERAIEALNYSAIKGRPCRIMWSQRDPALRKSGSGNVFIKNLDASLDHKALHDIFSDFGNILSCKVAVDLDGISKGYGFIHFETDEGAQAAIDGLNGMLINEKKVFVGHHVSRRDRASKIDEMKATFTNIYVKNLDPSVTEEDMRGDELFGQYGAITSAALSKDADGTSRCFGFVNYETHEAAEAAIAGLNEKEFRGQTLFVGRAQKKSERMEELSRSFDALKQEKMSKYYGVNLYVKNLDDVVDDEKLREEFTPFGAITSAKIMRDDKGASRGFGFVCYAGPEDAQKAIAEMNGRMIGTKPIFVALAQKKDIRRGQLEAQRMQWRMQQQMAAGMSGMYPGAPFMFPGGQMPQGGQRGYGYPQNNGGGMGRGRWNGPNAGQGYYPPQMMQQGYPGIPPNMNPGSGRVGGRGPNRGGNPRPNGPQGGRSMGRGGYKFNANARNMNGGMPMAAPVMQSPLVHLTSALASASPDRQKQLLGEYLYPQIESIQPTLAGKITGMLLEMDNGEILHLLESPKELDQKIQEAVVVLEEHQRTSQE